MILSMHSVLQRDYLLKKRKELIKQRFDLLAKMDCCTDYDQYDLFTFKLKKISLKMFNCNVELTK